MLERGDDVGGTWHYNTYPGLRLRRSVEPLLVLVRAQPGLVAHLLQAAGDPRVPGAHGRPLRRAREDPARLRGPRRPLGRGRAALGDRHLPGRGAREGPDLRHRAADGAEDPRPPRALEPSPARSSTPPAGTTPSTCAASASRRSAPARRRSSTCPRSRPEVEQLHVFQRTPPWVMPHSARPVTQLREAALPRRSGGPASDARRHLRRSRAARARLRQAAQGHGAGGEDRHQAPRALAARQARAARADDTATTPSAASASCPPTTGIRRSRATTSSSSPRASPRCASARS